MQTTAETTVPPILLAATAQSETNDDDSSAEASDLAAPDVRAASRAPLPEENLVDDDEDDDGRDDPRAKLDKSYTRSNTPRKRQERSSVWFNVRRLCGGHPMQAKGSTHVCIAPIYDADGEVTGFCNTFMTLFRDKSVGGKPGQWKTTKPGEHLADEHSSSKAGAAVAKRAKSADTGAEKKMFSFGAAMNDAAGGSKTMTTAAPFSSEFFKAYSLTPTEAVVTAQATAMVYTNQKVSKCALDDKYTRNVLFTAAGRKVGVFIFKIV